MFFCRFFETLKKISLTSFQTYIFLNIFRKLRQWKLSLSNFGHISSIVFEVIKTILSLFTFFFYNTILSVKNANQTKTSKTKTSEQKTTKELTFCAQKLLRGEKLFILCFFYLKYLLKKIEIVLITSFTILLKICGFWLCNYFYLFSSIHKTLWPNCQNKWLIPHGTFKNAGSKPVRGRFRGCGTLT